MKNQKILQVGVSLIEVLITLVVLGMGLMSLAKFQGTVMKDNSVGKERTVAIHLAQQKLEDLRNFSVLSTPPVQPVPPLASYQAIGNNLGGRIIAGATLALPSSTVLASELGNSNVEYERYWTVQDWHYPVAVNLPATTTDPNPPASPAPYGDLKQVVVTIKWKDKSGSFPANCTLPPAAAAAASDTRVCLISFISGTGPAPP